MDRFDNLVALNVKAPFRLMQGQLELLEDGGANVINMSSFWARKMIAGRSSSVYSMRCGASNRSQLRSRKSWEVRRSGKRHLAEHCSLGKF